MSTAATLDTVAFETHRPLLFGVAYRMLGSAAGAEDIVQDAYLRANAAKMDEVRSLRSYLVTIVTRLCLDELKSARATRESYIGPWLPEPILTGKGGADLGPEAAAETRDSISLAFLVLLERLGPVERAVFLLREVFDYEYEEISEAIGRSEAACRQAFRRARLRLEDGGRRFAPNREEQERLTLSFVQAAGSGNMAALMALLASDVISWSDGGGKIAAATQPVYGPDRVARLVIGLIKKAVNYGAIGSIELAEINGEVGIVWRGPAREPLNVIVLEARDGRIVAMRAMRNPDKLRGFVDG